MKTLFILLITIFGIQFSQAQFLEKLGEKAKNAAKRTVERRVEKEASKKTDETMDEVLSVKKGKNKNSKTGSSDSGESDNSGKSKGKGSAQSAKDFVAGNKIIATEDFKQDAIGDFPVNWYTNSGGEVVTFSGENTKWLHLYSKGTYAPMHIKRLPENFTFEFDLHATDAYSFYSTPLNLVFTQANEKSDYLKWGQFKTGKEGVIVSFSPQDAGSAAKGKSYLTSFSNGKKVIENNLGLDTFHKNQNTAKVQVWRQKNRLRVYVNGEKIWDLPQAFSDVNYNSIVFFTSEYYTKNDKLYIANLRLAEAGGDTRHKLIETGEFSSSDILFDSGKSNLKSGSQTVLDELGTALKENASINVLIIGHTDSDGDDTANQKLSEDRAKSVRDYLVSKHGIQSSRLITSGKGESEPISSNNSADGKKQNRRVEFRKL